MGLAPTPSSRRWGDGVRAVGLFREARYSAILRRMKILALERDLVDRPELETPLREEARRVWALYQEGVIREMYFRADEPTAVLMLEVPSVDDAHHVLGTLPLVTGGFVAFDLVPLAPYPGLARLFEQHEARGPGRSRE
jgi:muconolactone delta-isomerase